jgi:hypothetical protein
MEIKQLKIHFELGISLSIESMRLIKTLTEGYATVYMILDKSNNKSYIGSTFGNDVSSIHRRVSEHKSSWLKDLKNYELYILKSYFVKELLESNDSSSVNKLDKVIKEYESSLIANIIPEYNVYNSAQTYGERVNKEHTSKSHRQPPSAESRENMSKSRIGYELSETHKLNIGKAGGRPIKIILSTTKEEIIYDSILETFDDNWIGISERTLKRRLEDNKEFKTEKGIATAVYLETIDSGKIINDPNFIKIMKDISIMSKLEALLSIKIVYPKTNKRVTRERLEQAIKKYNELNE